MAPPRPPSELMPELVGEILLRVPPDDPARLARASSARPGAASSPTPPSAAATATSTERRPCSASSTITTPAEAGTVPRFVPTVTPSPFPQRALDGCDGWGVLDCRHGRVLFEIPGGGESVSLVVWDPTTGKRQGLPQPPIPRRGFTAAVLCAARGCDHLHCRGGPFFVVLVSNSNGVVVRPHLYSSEDDAWNASADQGRGYASTRKPSALIGDDVYFVLIPWDAILRYSLGKNCSSIIPHPEAHDIYGGVALMPMEDGSLGFASVLCSRICVWSWNAGPDVVAGWVRCRDIELQTPMPFGCSVEVVGSAEGFGTIFVATDVGVFTIELKSGRERKVGEHGEYYAIFPFTSFYTPDCASSILPSPAEAH